MMKLGGTGLTTKRGATAANALVAFAIAAMALVGCESDDGNPTETAPAGSPETEAAEIVKQELEGGDPEVKAGGERLPTTAPLATVGTRDVVTLLDPLSLAPVRRGTALGEYHDTYSFSPTGTAVAFGISADGGVAGGRIGIQVVDARTAEVALSIPTGVYGAGVAWLQSDRLVAVLGDQAICTPDCSNEDPSFSELVTVDPVTGHTLASSQIPHSCITAEARERALLSLSERSLSIITADGGVETVALPRKLAGCGGVAASEGGQEALVVSRDGGSIGKVGVSSGSLTVYDLPGQESVKDVIGLDAQRLIITPRGGGIDLLDLRTMRTTEIDRAAEEVRIDDRRIITFGTRGIGVRVYNLEGRRRTQLLKGETIVDLGIAGRFAYAVDGDGVAVIDLGTRRIVDRSSTTVRGDLLTEPSAP